MDSSMKESDFSCKFKERHSFNTLSHPNASSQLSSGQHFLIVTADDYGYDERRDEGILESFRNGIVTRASLLVNGSSAKTTAVRRAKENNMPLGVHLNITEGEPMLDRESSLKDDTGFMRGKFGLRDALREGKIDMEHVKEEINAQIQTFIQLVGSLPNHVDGHQHIHVLPGVTEIIAELMQAYSLSQIRIPLENNLPNWFDFNREFLNTVSQNAKAAMDIYRKHGIRFPDRFTGISLMGKYMSVQQLIQAIDKAGLVQQNASNTICELMVHPGYVCTSGVGGCGNGPDEFACSPEREHEARILQQPELRILLQKRKITLIS